MSKPKPQELMQPHQERVIQEKVELDIKIGRLRDFLRSSPIYLKLPLEEKLRLDRQKKAMCEYSDVLLERVEAFGLE